MPRHAIVVADVDGARGVDVALSGVGLADGDDVAIAVEIEAAGCVVHAAITAATTSATRSLALDVRTRRLGC